MTLPHYLPHYLERQADPSLSPERRARIRLLAARLPDRWGAVILEMGGDLTASEWAARSGIDAALIRPIIELHREYRRLEATCPK